MSKYILILCLFISACTDEPTAARILVNDGYTNIKFTGYNFLACGQGDFYSTGFIATKNNHQIKGTVCSGLLYKNATIRFE